MLKIRLMRIGAKKKPFYRVVAVDERAKRTGAYVELLGTYNPLTEPKDIKLKQDRIDYWIKLGAQPSDGYLRMTGKAPQRPPRKPKKEQKKEEPAVPVDQQAGESADQTVSESEEKIEETVKTEPEAEQKDQEVKATETPQEETPANEKEEVKDERSS